MLAPLLAALLLSSAPDAVAVQTPARQTAPSIPSVDAPTDLEDIVVEGRRLDQQVQTFVREVGAPAKNRGLARWRNGVCVGAANLRAETAQYLIDRVSDVAREVGLTPGRPGCIPNMTIIATVDAQAFTPAFVAGRERVFRVGGPGMDQGRAALETFKTTDRPVRWWHVSVQTNDEGEVAVRLPGMCSISGCAGGVTDFAPTIRTNASRLTTSTEDDIKQVFVIIDVDKISTIGVAQLADYVAMVGLAQIDPEAETGGYSTILNLFDDPAQTPGLTNWDKTYLQGLYDTVMTRRNQNTARNEVASAIVRAHADLVAAEDFE